MKPEPRGAIFVLTPARLCGVCRFFALLSWLLLSYCCNFFRDAFPEGFYEEVNGTGTSYFEARVPPLESFNTRMVLPRLRPHFRSPGYSGCSN